MKMSNVKSALHGIFSLLAIVFWLAALGLLLWQSWGWLSTGVWNSMPISAVLPNWDWALMASGTYAYVAVAVAAEQSLALGCGLLGVFCSFIARITD